MRLSLRLWQELLAGSLLPDPTTIQPEEPATTQPEDPATIQPEPDPKPDSRASASDGASPASPQAASLMEGAMRGLLCAFPGLIAWHTSLVGMVRSGGQLVSLRGQLLPSAALNSSLRPEREAAAVGLLGIVYRAAAANITREVGF